MKEIKFRAWDKYDNKMRLVKSVNYADDGFAKTIVARLVGGFNVGYVHGESCELMQYTGLKDKNGVEIYEGDIVKGEKINWAVSGEFGGVKETVGVVIFDHARFILEDNESGASPDLAMGSAYHDVIGNKYTNPELLEVKA